MEIHFLFWLIFAALFIVVFIFDLVYTSHHKGKINIKAALPEGLVAEASEFIISPNPATTEFTLQWINISGSALSIGIFDLSGKLIHQNNYQSFDGQATINISDLSSGIYFVKAISSTGEIFAEQFVKE